MTITYPYPDKDKVVYTDGVCFTNSCVSNLPGIHVISQSNDNPSMFALSEGWWWIPPSYRTCVYTAEEIMNNTFLDISTRINMMGGNFVHLEEEIRLDPYVPGLNDDIYFDITFFDERGILECLAADLTILDQGNLIKWKNKIELIDMLYG